MSISFNTKRINILYKFKEETIKLCINYIKNVVKSFSISKNLNTKLKEIEEDLYDIFCRWCFNSIKNNKFDFDLFLPNDESFIILEDINYYLHRFNINININDSFISFPFYQFNQIINNAIHVKEENNDKLIQISCSDMQMNRLLKIYKGSDFENDYKKLLLRYYYLGGLNNSLSIPPSVINSYHSHELFGTPINTSSNFCSPFSDETIFSSHGSFFNFTDYQPDTVYFANPPFDDKFCTDVANKLISDLHANLFTLIVVIPVWDTEQQKKYNIKNFGLPFDAYNLLIHSPFFIQEMYLNKNVYHFFNYFKQKNVFISHTHLINLGKPIDINKLVETWLKDTKNEL
jgi:hypothetical protein